MAKISQQELETYLWDAANILRGRMDAADFKTYIFPLLFVKRICDVHDEEFNEDSLEELDVYTEPQYLQLKEGEEIQFVRFGYCRKDSQNQAIFTHK